MNPLKTVTGTIVSGFVLAIILAQFFREIPTFAAGWSFIVWLHILAGITWIGLLYYFNFVQVPAVADAAGDSDGPGPPPSQSMSRRAPCCGSAGVRWRPG